MRAVESAAAEAAPSPALRRGKSRDSRWDARVSFAAPAVLETVREFEPEGDEDKSGETYEANAEVPAGFSIVEEASVETGRRGIARRLLNSRRRRRR